MRNSMCAVHCAAWLVVSGLSGCGGGGSDDSNSAAASTPAKSTFTREDVRLVAGLGANAGTLLTRGVLPTLNYLVGYAIGASVSSNGGSTPQSPAVACSGGGTTSRIVSKSGAHVGFIAGDKVSVAFDHCSALDDKTVTDGTAKLSVNSTISADTIVASGFKLALDVDLTGVSVTTASGREDFSGILQTQLTSDGATGAGDETLTVPATSAFSMTSTPNSMSTKSATSPTIGFLSGTVLDLSVANDSSPTSISLNGSITGLIFGKGAETYDIRTTVPLVSSAASDSASAPTKGVVSTTFSNSLGDGLAQRKLATSFSVDGSTVTVSGDTDGDGSMETVFTSTWTALTGP